MKKELAGNDETREESSASGGSRKKKANFGIKVQPREY